VTCPREPRERATKHPPHRQEPGAVRHQERQRQPLGAEPEPVEHQRRDHHHQRDHPPPLAITWASRWRLPTDAWHSTSSIAIGTSPTTIQRSPVRDLGMRRPARDHRRQHQRRHHRERRADARRQQQHRPQPDALVRHALPRDPPQQPLVEAEQRQSQQHPEHRHHQRVHAVGSRPVQTNDHDRQERDREFKPVPEQVDRQAPPQVAGVAMDRRLRGLDRRRRVRLSVRHQASSSPRTRLIVWIVMLVACTVPMPAPQIVTTSGRSARHSNIHANA
jgi:hypothetical protein